MKTILALFLGCLYMVNNSHKYTYYLKEKYTFPLAGKKKPLSAIWLVIYVCIIATITFLIRAIDVTRAFDIFSDEANYLSVSEGILKTLRPITIEGPFYLHPPAFFFLEAAYLKIVQPDNNIVHQIYAARYLNVIISVLSTILILFICRCTAGRWAALFAAIIFAFEPFIIRMDSRNFIETSATMWILIGYAFIISVMPIQATAEYQILNDQHSLSKYGHLLRTRMSRVAQLFTKVAYSNRSEQHTTSETLLDNSVSYVKLTNLSRIQWLRVLGAGIAFGLALLTKEVTLFMTLLPIAICFLLDWVLPRRALILIVFTVCSIYILYLLWVVSIGQWHEYEWQKLNGIMRFSGVHVSTGFTQDAGSSGPRSTFIEAVVRNLNQLATTYVILGLGVIAMCVLLWLGGRLNYLLVVWTASAYMQQGYSIFFGTNEEHFFYYLIVPAIIAITTSGVLLYYSLHSKKLLQKGLFSISICSILIFLCWTSFVSIQRHFSPDNGHEHLLEYIEQHVPREDTIDAATATSYWLLRQDNYDAKQWGTLDEVLDNKPEYVVISSKLVETGFDVATPELYTWLMHNTELVFIFKGPSTGYLCLYHISWKNIPNTGANTP